MVVDTLLLQAVDDTHSGVVVARSQTAAAPQSSRNSVHTAAHWEANIAVAVERDNKDPRKTADSEEEGLEEVPSSGCPYEASVHVDDDGEH